MKTMETELERRIKINEQIKKNHRGVGGKGHGLCLPDLTGKQGVTLAGQIALKIDPDILKELSGQVKEKIFVTCGTNGKTTTNNLLCSAIEAEGKRWSATIRAPICSTVWQQPSPRTLP